MISLILSDMIIVACPLLILSASSLLTLVGSNFSAFSISRSVFSSLTSRSFFALACSVSLFSWYFTRSISLLCIHASSSSFGLYSLITSAIVCAIVSWIAFSTASPDRRFFSFHRGPALRSTRESATPVLCFASYTLHRQRTVVSLLFKKSNFAFHRSTLTFIFVVVWVKTVCLIYLL